MSIRIYLVAILIKKKNKFVIYSALTLMYQSFIILHMIEIEYSILGFGFIITLYIVEVKR